MCVGGLLWETCHRLGRWWGRRPRRNRRGARSGL